MQINLTEKEANSVYVALVALSKQGNVDVDGMKVLLSLSDKFLVKEAPAEEPVKESKDDVKKEKAE